MNFELILLCAPVISAIFTYMLFARREELCAAFENVDTRCFRSILRFAGASTGAASTISTFAILAMIAISFTLRSL